MNFDVFDGIKLEHIRLAITFIDENGIPEIRKSKKYDLIDNNKKYPPKYVISIAKKYSCGKELDPNDFYGGNQTNNFLKSLGFVIEKKVR